PGVAGTLEGSTDPERGHALAEGALEPLRDRLLDDEALGGDAALAVVLDTRRHRLGNHRLEIGVGEHYEGVRPAELEDRLLERRAGATPDRDPGGLASGEGDRRDPG